MADRQEVEAVWALMSHALADARSRATPQDQHVRDYWRGRIAEELDRVRADRDGAEGMVKLADVEAALARRLEGPRQRGSCVTVNIDGLRAEFGEASDRVRAERTYPCGDDVCVPIAEYRALEAELARVRAESADGEWSAGEVEAMERALLAHLDEDDAMSAIQVLRPWLTPRSIEAEGMVKLADVLAFIEATPWNGVGTHDGIAGRLRAEFGEASDGR